MAIQKVQAIINGSTYTLTLNTSTGAYEADITAPSNSSYKNNSGHYFPVTVKATDVAGNSVTVDDTDATLGNSLKLKVKELTAPVISITSPTEGQLTTNAKPTVVFTVTDNDSGVNADSISIKVDSGSAVTSGITKTPISNGYTCSYAIPTALTDGSHTVKVNAKDNDGNSAVERTVNFRVDITPPVISITSPVNNLVTNKSSCVVSGSTSDPTAGIQSITVKLNSGVAQNVTLESDGTFTTTVTLAEGANTIEIIATDVGGLKSTVTRIVTLDTKAPVISQITLTPNPVTTGEVFKVSVKATD